MNSLTRLIDRLAGRQVAVAGDVMLDHFVIGRVDRISPEAPVPVVRFDREELRLGGAANVAHNLHALGARVTLVGLVGRDAAAAELQQALTASGLGGDALVVDASRPTTRKTRVVTSRNQQVARIDYEDDAPPSDAVIASLVDAVREASADRDALVLSDYRKGVVAAEVIAAAVDAARLRGIPLLIDPKVADADRYRGAALLTPNHHEAELMTRTTIRTDDDAAAAARWIHQRTGSSVVITRGEHGMCVLDASGSQTIETSLRAVAREVSDVTGAGDTVIAVLALSLAAGAPVLDAARLANLAASLVVGRFGPATVDRDTLASAARATE